MIRPSIADTGIIVALLDRTDAWHEWTVSEMRGLQLPFSTCEAVVTEACFLVAHLPEGKQKVLQLVSRGIFQIDFSLSDEIRAVERLMKKYADLPIDLADACLVRMSELNEKAIVFTLDSDFQVYRRRGKQTIPLLPPPETLKRGQKRKR
ncbi:MAG: pilus assembly protein [Acidobacteria bacterium]|nr:pilus assembly protein [Acidobacteriota bacterium]MCA1608167.1 pilus assembly protein [Acidobacteriota bacterium]